MRSGNPSDGEEVSGSGPEVLYEVLTITIRNPDLTPRSAAISGNASVGGMLEVTGNTSLAIANVSGTLGVSGNATLGNASVAGTLGVTGETNLANTIVGGQLTANGNVGIGTSTPDNQLSVAGNADISGTLNVTGALRADADSFLFANGSSDGSSNVVLRKDTNCAYIFPWGTGTNVNQVFIGGAVPTNFSVSGTTILSGNVGIGTDSPLAPLHVKTIMPAVPWSILDQYTLLGYYWSSSSRNEIVLGLTNGGQTQFPNTSILAEGSIAASVFFAFSDERIKNIQGRSDGATDLHTLLGIEVTDYRYKDVVRKGSAPRKKLIAQQVEKIFPQAVSKQTDVVPDIYQPASITDGWAALATDLKKGERVRLIADKAEGVYEVLEVTEDKFRTDFKPEGDKVFVFGREVDDFRTLDYDAIAMLNVSATQQLKKEKDEEVKVLRAECAELKAANDALTKRLQSLESKMESAPKAAAAKNIS
jgi:hypothetical protein